MADAVVLTCTDAAWLCWVEAHAGLAGWVQAIGSVAALLLGVVVLGVSMRLAREDLNEARAAESRAVVLEKMEKVAEAQRQAIAVLHAVDRIIEHFEHDIALLRIVEKRDLLALIHPKRSIFTANQSAIADLRGLNLWILPSRRCLELAVGIASLADTVVYTADIVLNPTYEESFRQDGLAHMESLFGSIKRWRTELESLLVVSDDTN